MKMSDGVEWGVHVCVALGRRLPADAALPAAKLAEYHGVPGAYLAKHLQALAGAGILATVKGARGGYRLARPAAEITVLEVVEAIDGDESAVPLQRDPPARPGGDAGRVSTRRCAASTRRSPEPTTRGAPSSPGRRIADLFIGLLQRRAAHGLEKGARWVQESAR